MKLELSTQERSRFYTLLDRKEKEIDEACRGNGRATKALRRKAADALLAAFNAELQSGNPRPTVEQCKDRVREEKFGFIETLLVLIIVNVIARLIVTWLIDLWNSRSKGG
jgi:hypothetical protein